MSPKYAFLLNSNHVCGTWNFGNVEVVPNPLVGNAKLNEMLIKGGVPGH